MRSQSKAPTYIVVDLRDVMNDYARQMHMYELYRRFPLMELVRTILASAPYNDHGEFVWNEMERRFNDDLDKFDLNIMAFYFETLTQYLDETIRRKVPEDVDTCSYVFHRWVDTNTVILQHDDNAKASHSFAETYFV